MTSNRIDLRSYHTESCSHSHDFAQLILPISGSLELEAGQYSGVISDNSGVYIAPNEQHCFSGSSTNLFLVVDFGDSNHLWAEHSRSNALNLTPNTKQFIQFTHYYLTHNERDFFSDSLINQLLFHFAAHSFSPEPDLMVIKAKQWIDVHFTSSIDIGRVAKHCHLSISQLQRRFKQLTGWSLAEYWRMNKLQHAKRLLSQKNCSIEAIAFAVGYEHLSAFSRCFTKVFGESPSQWKTNALICKEDA